MENERILQFFRYRRLPAHLQAISKPFAEMADFVMTLPRNPERTVALEEIAGSEGRGGTGEAGGVDARRAGERSRRSSG